MDFMDNLKNKTNEQHEAQNKDYFKDNFTMYLTFENHWILTRLFFPILWSTWVTNQPKEDLIWLQVVEDIQNFKDSYIVSATC